jgi:hypothetical protein
VTGAIAKKNAPSGAEGEFMGIIGPKIRPTSAPKHSERAIVRSFIKKALNGSVKIYDFVRKEIYEICCSEESFIPKL